MQKLMLNSLKPRNCLLAFIGLSLMACQQTSATATPAQKPTSASPQESNLDMNDKEKAVVTKLEWVKSANAKDDASKALAQTSAQSIELIAFSGRGKSFPGLTLEEYAEIESRVTYRFAEGSGDTLYGPTHKALRRDLRAYVSEYNKIIYGALTTPK